ncbi:MAG: hypothetical protein LC713_06615, partial [Actinobacteria bacterium]|nr:hypothetical protein [Actinomycetota bacterium]
MGVLLAARLVTAAGGSASPVLVGGVAAWCLAGVVAWSILRSDRVPAMRLGEVAARVARTGWIATVALAVVTTLAFVPDRLRGPASLAIALVVGAAIFSFVLAVGRLRLPRMAGVGVEVAVVGLILLAVIDATPSLAHLPYDPFGAQALPPGADANLLLLILVQIHQSFYLGPVADVLHGNAVLVDTFSQYGVGVIYLLALVFNVVPLGYGPMRLVSGGATGLAYAAGYGALRLAGCRRATAACALALGIAITQLDIVVGYLGSDFPSVGGLRFGPAYVLILVVVARARSQAHGRKLRASELVVVGISAIWSVEALVYALAIAFAAEGVAAASSPASGRPWARRWVAGVSGAVGAAIVAIAALILITRAVSGQWPDWGSYLAFLTLYSSRTVPGVLTFPSISAWSSGFAVGFVYLASAVTTARLTSVARSWPDLGPRLAAAAALTAFGTVSFSYWITHGAP